jgi:hypothetical protein
MDSPPIICVLASNKFNGSFFHSTIRFDGTKPASTFADWALPGQSGGYKS